VAFFIPMILALFLAGDDSWAAPADFFVKVKNKTTNQVHHK
jgi:hypothetical protein